MIDPALRARAETWRLQDPDPATVAELDALLAAGDEAALRDRFDASLSFGTAGIRGPLGAGPNRMNRVVVRRTAAALARWLDDTGAVGPVVIGRDARNGSLEFAGDSAAVIAGARREVVLAEGPVPTPLLARAVLALGASAGVMVTASHNPAGDNGYKVYASDGAQIVPPSDTEIAARIAAVGPVSDLPTAGVQSAAIRPFPASVADDYVRGIARLRVRPEVPPPIVAYTPLHGVGWELLRTAFAASGLAAPAVVPEQEAPDAAFPTVAFPNPEEAGAMDLVVDLAERIGAGVALANDPDADRLGVAVPDGRRWRILTGDEIGVLLADHLLRHGDGTDRLVATTVVSSSMLASIARHHGVHIVETLTGFKWLARAAMARPDLRFVFGYEEALGYSVGDLVRDKDGISAAVLFADLVGALSADGSSVPRRLDELSREHGVHVTRQLTFPFPGLDGPARMAARVEALRTDPPAAVGGAPVTEVEDLTSGGRLPPTDAVILRSQGVRVVVRPSGTEPKLKAYVEVIEPVVDGLGRARARASGRSTAVAHDLEELLS